MRAYVAFALSFGIYFFPIYSHGLSPLWGQVLIVAITDAPTFFNASLLLKLGLALLFQLFSAYCIYKLLELSFTAILIFCIPLILLLYGIFILAVNGPSGISVLFDQLKRILFI